MKKEKQIILLKITPESQERNMKRISNPIHLDIVEIDLDMYYSRILKANEIYM